MQLILQFQSIHSEIDFSSINYYTIKCELLMAPHQYSMTVNTSEKEMDLQMFLLSGWGGH